VSNTFRKSEQLGSVTDQSFPAYSDYVAALRRIERTTFDNSKEIVRRQIDELSRRAEIPEGVRIAVTEYADANKLGGRGIRMRSEITALLYIFSKNDNRVNKPLNELCEATGTQKRIVGRYITRLVLYGNLSIANRTAEEYLTMIGSKLSLEKELVQKGKELIAAFRKTEPSGITPRSLAASALALADRRDGHNYTQKQFAEAIGLKEYTVREDSTRMRKALGT
jgi:transcription initiation factor TFIIIB Brf1 subunit/transcription initiation factor TFIIB